MKTLSVFIILIVTSFSMAANNELSLKYEDSAPFTLEPSITFSSINDGSRFISLAFTGRVTSWLRLGMEFDMPADFDENAQIYQARILGRIMLLDRADKVYIQGAGTYAVFNYNYIDSLDPDALQFGPSSQTDSFYMLEAMAGYTRVLTPKWQIGGRMGVQYAQYSPALAATFNDFSGEFFYNRVTVYGNYAF